MDSIALIEKVLAGAMVLVCLALLLRPLVSDRWRYRIDAVFRRGARLGRRLWWRFYRWPLARRVARREADAAIRRARAASANPSGQAGGKAERQKTSGKSRKLH